MNCFRISEQELSSHVYIVMVGLWVPPPIVVSISFGWGKAVDRWLSTSTPALSVLEAIQVAVIQNSGCRADDSDFSGYILVQKAI
ncbi:hypothetical protein AVEN_75694-1 [Araneus ventricosus]|uniref:Uncharacterized protein n=2 Tax=Araneus ventricosus TaxID=182803 RepID=A0A4Y2V7Y8_ARAVE|nr:hypothetical protein AVEN_75694-1 [Araneus ventricosus]